MTARKGLGESPSSPHDREVLPLRSTPLPPTLLPAAAEISACRFLPPAQDTARWSCPHCHLVGQAGGHELWALCRENPRVQAAASCAHSNPTAGPSPGPTRTPAATAAPPAPRHHRRLWPKLVAEPVCRAPGQQNPWRGSRSEVAAWATLWPLTVASRPARAPPRGAGTGACRGAGGSRSSGQQHRAHDLLWQVPCSLEPAPSERW